jgi:hypothetical protein
MRTKTIAMALIVAATLAVFGGVTPLSRTGTPESAGRTGLL